MWIQKDTQKLIQYYNRLLNNTPMALEYLKIRGITKRSIFKFQLGYTYRDMGWQQFKQPSPFFIKSKHSYYDRFRNRVIFPIRNNKNIVSATSRAILDEEPKHLHLPGEIDTYFNQDALEKTQYVIIVESPLDCIILDQLNIRSVASLGVNGVSSRNIEILKKIPQIYICFDRDKNQAGLRGAIKLGRSLLKYNIQSKVITLPDNGEKTDIGIFFKDHSIDEFRTVVKNAYDINRMPTLKTEQSISIDPKNRDMIPCPFHKDTKPSMAIYYDTNSYFCFGCGAYGTLKNLEHS